MQEELLGGAFRKAVPFADPWQEQELISAGVARAYVAIQELILLLEAVEFEPVV